MTDKMREAFAIIDNYVRNTDPTEDVYNAFEYIQAGWQARDAEVAELVEALESISNANDVFTDTAMVDPWGHIQAVDDMACKALAKHKKR